MGGSASNPVALASGEYLLVDYVGPVAPPETIGVILREPASDRVHVRFRRDWENVDVDEADVLEALEEDVERAAREMGGDGFLRWLESSASNLIRVTDRESVVMHRAEKTLAELYRRFVKSTVQPFRTHVPVYACWAAATKFSGQQSVDEAPGEDDSLAENWLEAPPGQKLDKNMFAAEVRGASMEPRIPSGSLCLFRANVAGSRQGRLVLVEDRSARGGDAEKYTIKQYWSEKGGDPERLQTRILLKPLNPEFEAWELDESGQYAVIAEFVGVLE